MSLKNFRTSLATKIQVVEVMIGKARWDAREGDPEALDRISVLKAVLADLEARRGLPRSNALGELERILDRVQRSKTRLGYDQNQLQDLARHVINRWPFISQALEKFGEEGAE